MSLFYFIYVIILTMHEKQIARVEYLEYPQRYMMMLFCERLKELMIFSLKLFSQTKLDVWHGSNAVQSCQDSVWYYNTDDTRAIPSSDIQASK